MKPITEEEVNTYCDKLSAHEVHEVHVGLPSYVTKMMKDMHRLKRDLYEVGLYTADYSFNTRTVKHINFDKIADDLNYKNPLAIVTSEGQAWAIVHHTIEDKFKRSTSQEYEGTILHNAIFSKVTRIDLKDVSKLKADIKTIKQAQWVVPKNSEVKYDTPVEVNVSFVNV